MSYASQVCDKDTEDCAGGVKGDLWLTVVNQWEFKVYESHIARQPASQQGWAILQDCIAILSLGDQN